MIAQHLKLLANLLLHTMVVRVDAAQTSFKCIHIVQCELMLADVLNALHDFDQPAPAARRFIPKEQRLLPFFEHHVFRQTCPSRT